MRSDKRRRGANVAVGKGKTAVEAEGQEAYVRDAHQMGLTFELHPQLLSGIDYRKQPNLAGVCPQSHARNPNC